MKKKIFLGVVAVLILLCVVCLLFLRPTKMPELDSELEARFIYLIEESKELNEIFFGAGLPVYYRDNELSDRLGVYFNDEIVGYNRVIEGTSYLTVESIKEKAEEVYSSEYLSALYETAFDGVITGNNSAYLRFYDDGRWFYQNIFATDFELSERIYDYSTMEIVKPSSNDYINIKIESYTLENSERITVNLSFTYENGNWYLDSPTY